MQNTTRTYILYKQVVFNEGMEIIPQLSFYINVCMDSRKQRPRQKLLAKISR